MQAGVRRLSKTGPAPDHGQSALLQVAPEQQVEAAQAEAANAHCARARILRAITRRVANNLARMLVVQLVPDLEATALIANPKTGSGRPSPGGHSKNGFSTSRPDLTPDAEPRGIARRADTAARASANALRVAN